MPAFAHDGLVEFVAEGFWKLIDLIIAVDLDGLLRGIHDHFAVMAPVKMLFQFYPDLSIRGAVQVVGQLFQKIIAFHGWPFPSFFDLKYFARRSRSCKRARKSRDFTAGILRSSISAVSSVESPSTSRRTKTVLKPGGKP